MPGHDVNRAANGGRSRPAQVKRLELGWRASVVWEHHAVEAEFALRAVRAAGRLCQAVRQDAQRPSLSKADASPVTEADFASQALIAGWLAETFPEDPLIAEEDSRMLESDPGLTERVLVRVKQERPEADVRRVMTWLAHGGGRVSERFWTLDPIDGTKGFVRGDQYVVALALLEAGRVAVAALAAPMLGVDLRPQPNASGCVVLAVRGSGSWVMPLEGSGERRLKVSDCCMPSEARILRSLEDSHTDPRRLGQIAQRLGSSRPPVAVDSQAKYLIIAGGQAELLIRLLPSARPDYKEKLWDVAAGALVVEEAGGRVTDLRGEALDLTAGRELTRNQGGLVSNGHLHEAALSAVTAVLTETSP
jgi:3'(2'), 5'-bisphosphate nucleotidase